MEEFHFAVLDIGTTSIRCFVYDQKFAIVSSASRDIEILYPKYGFIEIEPEKLFSDVLEVIREAVKGSRLKFDQIILGISTQRSVRFIFL
jgi:putative glycerol kinase 5